MSYMCPICGYNKLDKPAYYKGISPSFEICPSCGFQYGKTDDDDGYTFEQWRQKWIEGNMVWDKGRSTPPAGWDPLKQLRNVSGK